MPVIRYRTRDLTRLLPGAARPMRRMARVTGRSDDMLIIRGVNVFPSQIEAVLAREERLAPHYVLELRRPKTLDELDVVVELRASLAGQLSGDEIAELERRAEHLIKAYIGVTAKAAASSRRRERSNARKGQGQARDRFAARGLSDDRRWTSARSPRTCGLCAHRRRICRLLRSTNGSPPSRARPASSATTAGFSRCIGRLARR